jgi:cytochrome c-type biogenesis protein CcmF
VTLTGVGPAALAVALAAVGATAGLAISGRPRAAARAFGAAFAALSVAMVVLAVGLATNDGSIAYVADHTSRATSWPYRLAGLWGGMEGSLLLWTWMAAGWAVAAGWAARRRLPDLARTVQAVLAAEVAVFCGLLVAVSRPFDQLAVPAIDGGGLNPVLLHPAMLYHPPLLYAGAAGLAVPFALAVAALASGRADGRWLALAVRSTRVSLLLLTAGLLAGAHWAYVELGWGGYWAWDPVENGGLLPWLAAVAFLHAAVVARRRDGPATSAAALAALAFSLGLLGSFLTRSGAGESVHAFAEARSVGWVLAAGLAITSVASTVLVLRARHRVPPSRPAQPTVSRRRAIAANNLLLVGLIVVIGFGTVFPVAARWMTGDRVVVTGRYFAVVATPLAVVLVGLIGIGPRLRWGVTADLRRRLAPAASGALAAALAGAWFAERRPVAIVMVGLAGAAAALIFAGWRHERSARWPLAHLGVAVLLAGVAGTTTGDHVTATLAPGEEVTVRGWTLRLDEVIPVSAGAVAGGRAVEARLDLSRGDRRLAVLRPVALVSGVGQRVSVAALRSTPLTDVQVALRAVGDGGGVAVLEVSVLPLVQLVWWGGLLIVAGLALGLGRSGRDRPPAAGEPVEEWAPEPRLPVMLDT